MSVYCGFHFVIASSYFANSFLVLPSIDTIMNTRIFPTKEECAVSLVHHLLDSATVAIEKYGYYWIALSGGSLLQILSAHLPQAHKSYARWRVVFVDERCVPFESPESNAGTAVRQLLSPRGFQEDQIYSIFSKAQTSMSLEDPNALASHYESVLKEGMAAFASSRPCLSGLPMLDTIVLGLGPDGHTASLFQGHDVYLENLSLVQSMQSARASFYVPPTRVEWVLGVSGSPKPPANRVTISLGMIGNAKDVVFFVSGADKADAVRKCLESSFDSPKLMDMEWLANLTPAAAVNLLRSNSTVWFLDREAASRVN